MKRRIWVVATLLLAGVLSPVFSQGATAAPSDSSGGSTEGVSVVQPAAPEGNVTAAPAESAQGPTQVVKLDAAGQPAVATIAADATVGFLAPLNYCSSQLVRTPVRNTSAMLKFVQVVVLNSGTTRTLYASVAAGATIFPSFYGVTGSYTAYLYVWNGSSYVYDELRSSSNVCRVAVTATCNAVTHVLHVVMTNTGTAIASVQTQRLLPLPQTSYFNGPVAGGPAVVRLVFVGNTNYAVAVDVLGSNLSPRYFAGFC